MNNYLFEKIKKIAKSYGIGYDETIHDIKRTKLIKL